MTINNIPGAQTRPVRRTTAGQRFEDTVLVLILLAVGVAAGAGLADLARYGQRFGPSVARFDQGWTVGSSICQKSRMTDVQPTGTDKARGKNGPTRGQDSRGWSVMGKSAMTATVRAKGGITLPLALRERLHLEEGDQVIVTEQDGSIVLTPATVIPRDQEWFWTPRVAGQGGRGRR